MKLKERMSFSEVQLKKDLTFIKNIFKTNGFYFATIKSSIVKNDKLNSIQLKLEIDQGKKAKINFLPLQPGDVPDTYANVDNLVKDFNYKPSTSVINGVSNFVKWYQKYYQL